MTEIDQVREARLFWTTSQLPTATNSAILQVTNGPWHLKGSKEDPINCSHDLLAKDLGQRQCSRRLVQPVEQV